LPYSVTVGPGTSWSVDIPIDPWERRPLAVERYRGAFSGRRGPLGASASGRRKVSRAFSGRRGRRPSQCEGADPSRAGERKK